MFVFEIKHNQDRVGLLRRGCALGLKRKIAGMCHYLLVDAPPQTVPSGRYGIFAIELLLQEMKDLGAVEHDLEARVFGGGAVVDALSTGSKGIGERNIEFADSKLLELGIPVKERVVGGSAGRRISLDAATGEVICETQGEGSDSGRVGVQVQLTKPLTKVLIVDDSATVRTILRSVFDKSKKISVVGVAVDPFEARDKIVQLKPDVLTLDIEMPRMNGIQFLEKLMNHHPMPVVVVSSLSSQGAAADKALELGAVEFVHKPSQFDPQVLSDLAETLIPKVIGAASLDIKAVKSKPTTVSKTHGVKASVSKTNRQKMEPVSIVGVGGNGGASDALQELLRGLAADTPPVVVALSTISGFAANWIHKTQPGCKVKLELIQEGQILRQGSVYIASSDAHVKVVNDNGKYRIELLRAAPVSGQRPSADILFDSLSHACAGSSIGVLLSGYGRDGVSGLTRLRDSGGWVIAQDPHDCSFNFSVIAAMEAGIVNDTATRDQLALKVYDRRSAAIV